uniref:Putative ovule protein n=1 Tax=Solanum chacoense TaxID=4108 RepID=A0A0V0HFR9_SOLCH
MVYNYRNIQQYIVIHKTTTGFWSFLSDQFKTQNLSDKVDSNRNKCTKSGTQNIHMNMFIVVGTWV